MEIMKNIKKNTIILFIITLIILYIVLKDDLPKVIKALSTMDYKYILVAIIVYLLSICFKAYATYKTVNDSKKITLKEAIKHNIITQFFNGIIFYQTALVIFGFIAVGYNWIFHIFPKVTFLRKLVLLGFSINILVAVALFIITFSKKLTHKIMSFLIKLLSKIKIIKNKEKIIDNWNTKLEEFHTSAKKLRKRRGLFYIGVLSNIISLVLLYSVPIFILFSLHDYTSMNIMETITSSAYVLLIGAFVPIPGASGGIEYGFMQFFGNFLNKKIITTMLLMWRFITYYLGMILGAMALSFEKKER